MPKLSDLTTGTVTRVIQVRGMDLTVIGDPDKITVRVLEDMSERASALETAAANGQGSSLVRAQRFLCEMLEFLVDDWDLQDNRGRKIPPKVDKLVAVPVGILNDIFGALQAQAGVSEGEGGSSEPPS